MKVSINDLVDSLLSQQSRSQVFLQRTRKLDPNDPADRKIYELMNNPSYADRITGHLLNLITTGERAVFCISIRSLNESIKCDPNWKRTASMNAKDRKIAFGIIRKFLVEELVAFDEDLATPGIYRLKHKLVRAYLSDKLGVDLREIEIEQEAQCRDWVQKKKENRVEKLNAQSPASLEQVIGQPIISNKLQLDTKMKIRIVEDVMLASVQGQPLAGRSRAITLACRDILDMNGEDIPKDVFDSYDELKATECKSSIREAWRINLNHWIESAKDSELETHNRLCEMIQVHCDVKMGRKKRNEVRLSFDLTECENQMLLRIAFGLFGIKYRSRMNPSPHLTAVI